MSTRGGGAICLGRPGICARVSSCDVIVDSVSGFTVVARAHGETMWHSRTRRPSQDFRQVFSRIGLPAIKWPLTRVRFAPRAFAFDPSNVRYSYCSAAVCVFAAIDICTPRDTLCTRGDMHVRENETPPIGMALTRPANHVAYRVEKVFDDRRTTQEPRRVIKSTARHAARGVRPKISPIDYIV